MKSEKSNTAESEMRVSTNSWVDVRAETGTLDVYKREVAAPSNCQITSLRSSSSAIDLYLHTNNDCGGDNALRCSNINPNVCCGVNANGSPYQSIAARGIPTFWNVQARGYDAGQYSRLQTISGNNGDNWICNRSNGFRYTGAGYNFVGRKRVDPAIGAECQRPNALVLADGTEYDLASLSDGDFGSFVALGINATGPADVPQQLQPLRIK
ncbi:hypothetical protein QBC44DRAFT_304100 [Cladorrhinum sp. PSN332]|nr:hypothetical protein QBC44DRAFT_304100 [Cladorrhinum sp. PSN332]